MTPDTDADTARAIAEHERIRLTRADPTWAQWQNAVAGAPVLVHTMEGAPSYWLVPIDATGGSQDSFAGFVRVTLSGRVAAAGRMGGRTNVVTGITSDDARRAAAAAVQPDAAIGTPVFVHDGPPGRDGWRVDVTTADGKQRILLVTRGGVTDAGGGGGGGGGERG